LLSWILINTNTYWMVMYGEALFNEINLIYFVNIMQFTALVWLVWNVFNELLVICRIKMWKVKPKQRETVVLTKLPTSLPTQTQPSDKGDMSSLLMNNKKDLEEKTIDHV